MKETLATKDEAYYAVVYTITRHEPAQGHGYPATNYPELKYEEVGTQKDLEKWLMDNHTSSYPKKDYKVVRCTPVDVELKITFKTKPVMRGE